MNHTIPTLNNIQQRILWLAVNMIHHANHVRPNPEGSKIGGHQASSASMVTLMTALYFHYLRAGDRVSVKPHASPVFHAIQYLLGNLSRDYLTQLRAYYGLQAYPSRSKDPDQVDFSTGSVGLGAVAPAFAALANQYTAAHFNKLLSRRFIALVGDAELDEGNVWEAILDPSLAKLGNLLWIVDLNRQSLDRVVPGIRAAQLKRLFADSGWQVLEAKYGRQLQTLFNQPNGHLLRQRIDEMPNEQYQAAIRLPGAHIRRLLCKNHEAVANLLSPISDDELPAILQNLGGHDLAELLSCLAEADAETERPSVLFAYTIKGWGLPIAGHPLNHSMLLDQSQIDDLRQQLAVGGDEWAAFAAESPEGALCAAVAQRLYPPNPPQPRRLDPASLPDTINVPSHKDVSTQQTFGRLLMSLSREEAVTRHLVTAAPDVSVSTNLSGWIAKMGVFSPQETRNYEQEANHPSNWSQGPDGQHIELGISEMNLFMMLGMFGIADDLIGQQLLPIGAVYDPFVLRGLDAFIYALYSGSKFIVAGTPSGITLAPEGGAHQSTITPSVGIELPNLHTYEPCYAQELAWIMVEALRQCCDVENGRATYLRLSTKPIGQRPFQQAAQRIGETKLRQQVIAGGYRLHDWRTAVDPLHKEYLVHIATSGAMLPEALAAATVLEAEGIPANVLNLTSPRRLFEAWRQMAWGKGQTMLPIANQPFDWLIPQNERHAPIITISDSASHTLSWLGGVFGAMVVPLGVDQFGQSGARADLYQHYQIDANAIVDAALTALNRSGLY
ncbi:MAG: pyruvate dehydrogenase [Chloroflexi bacterium]|nr:pyruvate dehydrogenase [Chloroflexota bacterium]